MVSALGTSGKMIPPLRFEWALPPFGVDADEAVLGDLAPAWASVAASPTRAAGRKCRSKRVRPHGVVTAGWPDRASARPPAEAPSDPVTTTRSPGRAPERKTARPRATSPTTMTEITT